MSQITIKVATLDDAEEMLAIYAPYVTNTTVSSEYEAPSLAEFCRRIETYTKILPWLVCRIDGRVAGYGYASPHRARAGYQWSVETSIYVSPDFHRQGVAAAIYRALFALLVRQGYYNIFVGITSPNERSIKFHTAMGFTISGAYHLDGKEPAAARDRAGPDRAVPRGPGGGTDRRHPGGPGRDRPAG